MKGTTKPVERRPGWFYRIMMAFVGLFDRWLHLSCRSFMRTASSKYERSLSPGERCRQSVHRAMCGICRVQERRMDRLRELVLEVGTSYDEDLDVTLSDEARERIRSLLEAGGREPRQR